MLWRVFQKRAWALGLWKPPAEHRAEERAAELMLDPGGPGEWGEKAKNCG